MYHPMYDPIPMSVTLRTSTVHSGHQPKLRTLTQFHAHHALVQPSALAPLTPLVHPPQIQPSAPGPLLYPSQIQPSATAPLLVPPMALGRQRRSSHRKATEPSDMAMRPPSLLAAATHLAAAAHQQQRPTVDLVDCRPDGGVVVGNHANLCCCRFGGDAYGDRASSSSLWSALDSTKSGPNPLSAKDSAPENPGRYC